jgi:hypothetical protein
MALSGGIEAIFPAVSEFLTEIPKLLKALTVTP